MANSRSPYHFGRDPFQPPPVTPGPLGYNDAASPHIAGTMVGDTPGPLRINDHADPNRKVKASPETNGEKQKGQPLPRTMSISDLGVKFIWREEYVKGISERLHWPRGASWVTLGAGYDMKTRSHAQVVGDLVGIGVCASTSDKAAEGAGLSGPAAERFVYKNREAIILREEQASRLLRLILPAYENSVKQLVRVPLSQHEYDALVCFAYNPGGRLRKVATCINEGRVPEAMDHITAACTSGGKILKALVGRRRREVSLYLHGRYTR